MPAGNRNTFEPLPDDDFVPPQQMPAAEAEDEFADIVLDVPAMIREGEAANAPRLKLRSGQAAKVRLLPFGRPSRSISLIGRHLVYQFGRLGCPGITDAALGGNKERPCPLCGLVRRGDYPRHLRPGPLIEVWAYALVLAVKEGDVWHDTDLETVDRPHRLQFEGTSRTRILAELRNDPLLADEEHGTNLLITVNALGNWQLRLLDRSPLQLSWIPAVRENQLRRIRAWLGEPHMWRGRQANMNDTPACGDAYPVATDKELTAAARHLASHYNAPRRSDRRFWEQLMSGSLPPWSPNP